MSTSTPAGVVRPMPIGALAKALRRSAGGSDPTTSVTAHLPAVQRPGTLSAGPPGFILQDQYPKEKSHVRQAFRVARSGDRAEGQDGTGERTAARRRNA